MRKIASVFLLATVALTGCASVSMLPQSANEVTFRDGVEGKTGWSAYRELELFEFFIVLVLSVTVKAASSIYAPCKAVLFHKAH